MNLSSGVDFYTSMIEAGAHAYVAAANAIARRGRRCPRCFSCMAGKDRTGVFAAIVLGLLGVPDEVIVEDYVAHPRGDAAIAANVAAPNS